MGYFEWLEMPQACCCGWAGTGRETRAHDLFEEVLEFACPECREKIGHVLLPTVADIDEAAARGVPEAIKMLDRGD
jgi:hypothetical protein